MRQPIVDSADARFRVDETARAGQRLIVLRDLTARSEATLLPGLGFACVAFRVEGQDGAWPVLSEPPDDDTLLHRTTRYGIPILFPWPNRIRDGRFSFERREYQMPVTPDGPNANHGLVRERAWTLESVAPAEAASCAASVTIGGDAGEAWPWRCRLTLSYRLIGNVLSIGARVDNLSGSRMPFGFGLHPWFGLPLGRGGSRASTELSIPATATWELQDNLPTGRVLPIEQAIDLRSWRPLTDLFIDDVYTGLTLEDGWFESSVRDPSSGRAVTVRSSAAFREHVVYAPLNREVVCLEPYTCPTDAFNLAARALDVGHVALEPGETWSGDVTITASV